MTIVAFGVTGDLMRQKILPALLGLYERGGLPESVRILGISRRSWSDDEFRAYLHDVLPQAGEVFLSLFRFMQGDAEDRATLVALARAIENDDALIYVALSPALYKSVFAHMREAGFGTRSRATRVILEKPFSTSGAGARELDTELGSLFAPQDVFLADHYLAKDWVRELGLPAQAGGLSVARERVAQIHVRFFERAGVERRGPVYDQLGAIRDVGQNHMLQILTHLVTPHDRVKGLEGLAPLTAAQVATMTLRAQYEGYHAIDGVAPDSSVETYFKVRTTLEVSGWGSKNVVEVVLEGGKGLAEDRKEISLTLEDGSKVVRAEHPSLVHEYEQLIAAALRGDQSLFCPVDEAQAQWRFIDPILAAWATGTPALTTYPLGSTP